MKRTLFLLVAALCCAFNSFAGNGTVIDQGKKQMKAGLGDYSEIAYAFAKGDKITLDAKSSKMLDRVTIVMYPQTEITRIRATKHTNKEFIVPQDGVVIIRFVADRGGTTNVNYTVTREPASDEVKDYNTKVTWEKPTDKPGPLVPVQAKP
jgi:hypothetical protein